MKKRSLLILSCIIALCASSMPSLANYAAGGELVYQWLSGSNYKFYFRLYRDCGGNTEPTTIPLCFSNSCNSSTFTLTMTKTSAPVPPFQQAGCPTLVTKCDNPSATIPGYQEIWYSVSANLPSQCNSWRMFVSLATRSGSLNIANASSTNMYIEAYFNNTGSFQGNTSPFYGPKPLANACHDPFGFYNDASDPNGDSLVYEVIQPLTSTSSCSVTPSVTSFVSTTPPLSIPNNPFQTHNTFVIDSLQGLITFDSSLDGTHTVVIRTKEYRNGVLIGSVMREMPINVYDCPSPPMIRVTKGGTPIMGTVFACPGNPLNFDIEANSPDAGSMLFMSDNHNTAIPGTIINYQNQETDSVTGSFTWQVPGNAAGSYALTVTVRDSTCNLPFDVPGYIVNIPINVVTQVEADPDTTICTGTPVELKLPLPMYQTWLVLSGDMGSLSCLTCSNPIVTPTTSSQYEVTVYALPAGCPSKDTVYVNVIPYNKPSASIAVSPGTNVWPDLNVTFTATVTYCNTPQYQWQVNGFNIVGATGAVFNTTTLANNDIVTCVLRCSDTCVIDTPSNAITMNVATDVGDVSTYPTRLYPNPNKGSFTLAISETSGELNVDILNTLGQIVWSQRRVNTGNSKTMEIQTTSLPAGHYILKLRDNNKTNVLRFSISQ